MVAMYGLFKRNNYLDIKRKKLNNLFNLVKSLKNNEDRVRADLYACWLLLCKKEYLELCGGVKLSYDLEYMIIVNVIHVLLDQYNQLLFAYSFQEDQSDLVCSV